MESQSDQALMRIVQGGDPLPFAELVRRYQPALLRVAFSRLGRRDWAEDVVQETFLAAFKSRHTYNEQFGFRTWLWTILLNECRRSQSTHARTPRVSCWSDESAAAHEPALYQASVDRGEPLPLARLLDQEQSALLETLLARLSVVQADALRLRFFGELKFPEIAAAMGCSLPTAKNRVRWGLMRLAKWINDPAAEPLAEEHESGETTGSSGDEDGEWHND
jgi:RNA polymerase sigma-70 factor (ECF subfamily)